MDIIDHFRLTKYVFVIGIGGSDLASKAVWNAITLHKPIMDKKLFFLESPDTREYEEAKYFIENEDTAPGDLCLIVISKSGETRETLSAFENIFEMLSGKFGRPIKERVIAVSTPGTKLWQMANENGFINIPWEDNIGGRWSAFTSPHKTVLTVAGLDARGFVKSGIDFDQVFMQKSEENMAFLLAKNIFNHYKKGFDILDFFFFNSELEDLGKWARQLIAESLGKTNKHGKKVGIVPVVSIGPTDLHSELQLILGGPKNRFTLFVRSLKEVENTVNESAYQNTIKAYEDADLPFEKYEMPEINERELACFMASMMATTIFLSEMLGVNPYDQPEVEEYKKHLTDN